MGFFGLLRSIEDLLYEIMMWLVFYPRTLLRVVRNPLQMIEYSEQEQGDSADQQYTDTLSPPLFLMLTILLAHAVELSFGQKGNDMDGALGKLFANSEETLLLYRSVIFSIYPVTFAVAAVKRGAQDLDRTTLRQPFFSQCYLGALFALAVSLLTTNFGFGKEAVMIAEFGALGVVVLIYIALQSVWLKSHLPLSTAKAALVSFGTFLKATVVVMIISSAMVA